MTLAGLSLPHLSAFDPPIAGEGSLDPMGLGALSERLADRLVPGLRARMQSIRFVTAMAVGATACEAIAEQASADGTSTSPICFEWLVVESLVRRLSVQEMPKGVPGSQKARTVIERGERLSAPTYLKIPTVFGFNGIYKPFAIDAGVVSSDLKPGPRCAELTYSWERDQGFEGFTDAVTGSEGARLRTQIRDQVSDALRNGRCVTKSGSSLFGNIAASLRPDRAGALERRALRSLITDGQHDTRTELAAQLSKIKGDMAESDLIAAVRPSSSTALAQVIDAVVAYEELARLLDVAFRTLCWKSYSLGLEPLTPAVFDADPTFKDLCVQLPRRYSAAREQIAYLGLEITLEDRLGDFGIPRRPTELVTLLLAHHDHIQADKPPEGKRSWFEPFRGGWVVRAPYALPHRPGIGEDFVHPIRLLSLRRFMTDTAD